MPSPTTAHESAIAGHIPSTMTAVTARTYGGPEVLATEELPVPSPQTGELLVEVRATSLNALDWHVLTGTPYLMRLMSGLRRPKRFVRGADVAGDGDDPFGGHGVERLAATGFVTEAVEAVVLQDLAAHALVGAAASGPHEQDQGAVGYRAQQPLDDGGAEEAGGHLVAVGADEFF